MSSTSFVKILDAVEKGIAAIIQVVLHSHVGVMTSVAFVPFGIALKAVPHMSMAIAVTQTARPFDKSQSMAGLQVLDNLAKSLKLLFCTRQSCVFA